MCSPQIIHSSCIPNEMYMLRGGRLVLGYSPEAPPCSLGQREGIVRWRRYHGSSRPQRPTRMFSGESMEGALRWRTQTSGHDSRCHREWQLSLSDAAPRLDPSEARQRSDTEQIRTMPEMEKGRPPENKRSRKPAHPVKREINQEMKVRGKVLAAVWFSGGECRA